MDIKRVHPELRNVVRKIPPLPFYQRWFVWLLNVLTRLLPKPKRLNGVSIHEEKIGTAGVRVYTPDANPSGAGLLWIHGGGHLVGSAVQDDRLCAQYARELGLKVVSAEYRLSPTFPFPAALDDCLAAWQWFVQQASALGVDPARIAIGGQSAGGGLAAGLVQRIHDSGGPQPAAQLLFCPMLDDRTAADTTLDTLKHRIWSNQSNRAGWSAYLQQPPGQQQVPAYAVPARRDNLAGLPPAWIGVGDIDLFFDEDRHYHERLAQQDVKTELHVVPMAPHGFETLVPDAPVAQAMFQSSFRFLKGALGV